MLIKTDTYQKSRYWLLMPAVGPAIFVALYDISTLLQVAGIGSMADNGVAGSAEGYVF